MLVIISPKLKKGDKGGDMVIWPIDHYFMEGKRQLNNNDFYVVLLTDPIEIFKQKLGNLLKLAIH